MSTTRYVYYINIFFIFLFYFLTPKSQKYTFIFGSIFYFILDLLYWNLDRILQSRSNCEFNINNIEAADGEKWMIEYKYNNDNNYYRYQKPCYIKVIGKYVMCIYYCDNLMYI